MLKLKSMMKVLMLLVVVGEWPWRRESGSEDRVSKKNLVWSVMIMMCSLFDLMVKIQFVHGGKVEYISMLNSTLVPTPFHILVSSIQKN
jgi:hypothetical protein